jgi:hypothetical protein
MSCPSRKLCPLYFKEEDAIKMIELGMNNSDIRKITGLSLKRINELRKKSCRVLICIYLN